MLQELNEMHKLKCFKVVTFYIYSSLSLSTFILLQLLINYGCNAVQTKVQTRARQDSDVIKAGCNWVLIFYSCLSFGCVCVLSTGEGKGGTRGMVN